MSLQVWLPLNGDTKNRGINGSVVTNNGTGINTAGKIGKCYSFFNTGSNYMQINDVNIPTNSWSMSAWVYPTGDTSSGHQYVVGMNTSTSADFLGVICIHTNKFAIRIADTTYYAPTTSALNKWYHVAATYNGNQAKLYVDGSLVGTFSTKSPVAATKVFIGTRGGLAGYFSGRLNDVRVYSHVLSPLEIKELSRALVFHYKLDDLISSQNLIPNGYGEFGGDNWSSPTNISTTELPPNSTAKASIKNNRTKDFIPINPHHSYTISCKIKKINSNTGSSYPSIEPYDADKKFINNYNTASGFKPNSLTTLTQPLNPGDTVIHVASLTNWSTADNYYFRIAIFGYKDSFGNLYDDLIYTADAPAFGTKTDKSHINFDNLTITLNSAFTGKARPVGTHVCQSTGGSTYWYPFGEINVANITDWTAKTKTFIPANDTRLKPMRYMKFFTYDAKLWFAENFLIDNSNTDNKEADSSGNGYSGTFTGIPYFINDSGRHIISMYTINGVNNYMSAPLVITPTAITMNIWIKSKDSSNGVGSYHIPFCIDGEAYEMSIGSDGKLRNGFKINGTRYVDTTTSKNVITDHAWHMLTATYDGTTIKRYVDGELVGTRAISGTLSTTSKVWLGRYGTSTTYGDKNLYKSDVRLYATALSADDIKQLYQDAAYITRNGELHSYDIFEDDTAANPMIKHTGVADAKGNLINDNLLKETPKSYSSSSYCAYQLQLTENMVAGQTYTLQFWDVDVAHSGKTAAQLGLSVYWGGGSVGIFDMNGTSYFTNGHANYLKQTFTITSSQASGSGASNAWLNIYNSVPSASGTLSMHIGKWKLEKGNKPTPWVPEPTNSKYNGLQHGFIELDELNSSASVDIYRGHFEAKDFIEM